MKTTQLKNKVFCFFKGSRDNTQLLPVNWYLRSSQRKRVQKERIEQESQDGTEWEETSKEAEELGESKNEFLENFLVVVTKETSCYANE